MNLFDCETSFASGRNKPHYTHGDSMIMIGRVCNPKTHIRNLLLEQIRLMKREDSRVSATAKRSLLQLLQVIDKLPNDMLEEIYTYYMPLQNKDRKKICCNNQPQIAPETADSCESANKLARSSLFSTSASSLDDFLAHKTIKGLSSDDCLVFSGRLERKDDELLPILTGQGFQDYDYESTNQKACANSINDDSCVGKRRPQTKISRDDVNHITEDCRLSSHSLNLESIFLENDAQSFYRPDGIDQLAHVEAGDIDGLRSIRDF